MPTKRISQREARKLRKELDRMREAERMRGIQWRSGYPGGVHVQNVTVSPEAAARLDTAARLDHALVAKIEGSTLRLYAMKR